MKPQYEADQIPLLNTAQKVLYVVYALCMIVAALDIWFWRT